MSSNTGEIVARRTGLPLRGVEASITLLDDGATIPFISRYRKEHTGGLDEVALREIETTLRLVRELEKRKEFVIASIEGSGSLTHELKDKILKAEDATTVEDLYAPFKPRRRTRATIAREKGLEGLARIIMAGRSSSIEASAAKFTGKEGVEDTAEAIAGASDIIAEWASDPPPRLPPRRLHLLVGCQGKGGR